MKGWFYTFNYKIAGGTKSKVWYRFRVRSFYTFKIHSWSACHTQSDTKKRELLKNPTKIEEIQEKKFIDRN